MNKFFFSSFHSIGVPFLIQRKEVIVGNFRTWFLSESSTQKYCVSVVFFASQKYCVSVVLLVRSNEKQARAAGMQSNVERIADDDE